MNLQLKITIIEKFGTQADFAMAVGAREDVVSRVVRGRRKLNEAEKKHWGQILGTDAKTLFESM